MGFILHVITLLTISRAILAYSRIKMKFSRLILEFKRGKFKKFGHGRLNLRIIKTICSSSKPANSSFRYDEWVISQMGIQMRWCCLKTLVTSSKTAAGSTSELMFTFFFNSSQYFTISLVSPSQVLNRFLMLSMLSSDRPLVSPRFSNLWSMVSSLHSRWRMKGMLTFSFMIFSQVLRFSMFLGKPSMRKRPPSKPALFMAFCSSITVISLGTIFPSTMYFSMVSPYCDPGVLRSARSRSPAERCTNLNSCWMRSLCVPLPDPGPPRMKTTVVFWAIQQIKIFYCAGTNEGLIK